MAVAAGHTELACLLLQYGCKIHENVWAEDSEFYLATQHGHMEIINLLFDRYHCKSIDCKNKAYQKN